MSISGEKIKSFAEQLGFSFCGIAKAELLSDQKEYNEDLIRKKHHEPFKYLETNLDKRLDPAKILPDVKSVIAVLINYYPDKIVPVEDNFIISKYAYGSDYQKVVKKKLEDLIRFLPSLSPSSPGGVGLCFVDSGSVMEKVWAQRCGIGWQGKNTILINKNAGSFFFIGIILTNLELESDEPETDRCGTCNKCREACPTGALDHPYQLNISKCISFHTIESKEPIPNEFRGKFRDRIFGCDICQDVCPYNRFSKPSCDAMRTPHPDLLLMKKKDWFFLTENHFNVIFKGTPVYRIGYQRLMRNIRFVARD